MEERVGRGEHDGAGGGVAADSDDAFLQELRDHVAKEIGAIAKPRQIMVVAELPKTRSGKIMRRLLRDVARGRPLGDVTTLANAEVVEQIHTMVESGAGSGEE